MADQSASKSQSKEQPQAQEQHPQQEQIPQQTHASTRPPPQAMAMSAAGGPSAATGNSIAHPHSTKNNVIIIKYANVTAGSEQAQVNVFELHDEPLSVSVIESRFATRVQSFDVSHNQLSTLSKDLFCPLSNEVRQLNISHNALENFDCLGLISQAGQLCLSELRVLDMSFNLIRHLPATGVATLHNLEVLNLASNQIESLDELSLSSLFKLTRLDLSQNRVQQLPVRLFHKSAAMQVLRLGANRIQSHISQPLLAGLTALEEIDLSANNISQVAEFAFADKPNITRVDLSRNALAGLRQDVLRVSAVASKSAPTGAHLSAGATRHRLHHNGQFAGTVSVARVPGASTSAVEFLLAANPFVCDCNLEWLRKLQPSGRRAHPHQHQSVLPGHELAADPLGAQLGQLLQSDQPSAVMPAELSGTDLSAFPSASQRAAGSATQLARVADLDLIKCSPLFKRNLPRASRHRAPPADAHHNYSLKPGHAHPHQNSDTIELASADASNFLCRYKSHCFALCHCCEFDACDCERICPAGCSCYYDQSWQTNIIDCSAGNHTVVPDRIPMDVVGLYLDGNNIDSLKPSNLIARKSLRTLYLNSTNLQHIANRTFNGLIELQTLYLNNNMLRQLNGYEFEPLAQLRALYLQSNRLDHISNQTFIYLRSLEVLDLSNNRLTSSNLDLFASIGHHNIRLRQLSIAHNWWSCQCQAINRFRSLLKQKFLISNSVAIADKHQLRCYFNSTAYGPHILEVSPAASSLQQQQYPSSNRQQLTEIGQCSDALDEAPPAGDLSPPPIYPLPSSDEPGPPLQIAPNDQQQQQQEPAREDPYQEPVVPQQQPAYPYPAPDNFHQAHWPPLLVEGPSQPTAPSGSATALGSLMLVSVLMLGVVAVAVALLLFVRQQQSRFHQHHQHRRRHHKSSSGASTSSGASSVASSAGADPRGHAHLQHAVKASGAYHSQLLLGGQPHAQLVGGALVGPAMQSLHRHSNSSQSNIYAALVSPTTANSTIVTSAHSNMNLAQQPSNIYSNSSTSASHQSVAGYWHQSQQQQHQQHYGVQQAAYAESAYHFGGHPHSQASYKTGASLYQGAGGQEQPAEWALRLPKVKRLVSRLVSKSLALGGLRSGGRPDELGSALASDKIYDAFISYDKRDELFVTQHLSPELEHGQPQYRVADRFRDLPPPDSAYIGEAISSVLSCSQRTIAVLSAGYLASEWCRLELRAALREAQADRSHRIILVVLEPKWVGALDAETRALLGQLAEPEQQLVATLAEGGQRVLSQPQGSQPLAWLEYGDCRFWSRLRQLMPAPRPLGQPLTLTTKS